MKVERRNSIRLITYQAGYKITYICKIAQMIMIFVPFLHLHQSIMISRKLQKEATDKGSGGLQVAQHGVRNVQSFFAEIQDSSQ